MIEFGHLPEIQINGPFHDVFQAFYPWLYIIFTSSITISS